MEYKEIIYQSINGDKYYTNTDLRMNRKYGFLLSSKGLEEYLNYKDQLVDDHKIELPLLSWNSKGIYYFHANELSQSIHEYIEYFMKNIEIHKEAYVTRNLNEISIGILASELEGTLKIESVNTTRRQIEKIISGKSIQDKNEQIIYNMYQGLKFILEVPEFTKENLKVLYELLSKDCLDKEDELGASYYRSDVVYIAEHTGCPASRIEECMDSLFAYVKNTLEEKNPMSRLLLPFIAHYYILYIHPYFDYNGRTARMVQLWLFLSLEGIPSLYLSEAINDNKKFYYNAIEDTRVTHNDLTYFLIYLFQLCNSYYLVHKNIDEICSNIESNGESISLQDIHYLKRIILHKNVKWFNYKAFMEFAGLDITKQGALKILNRFEKYGFLITRKNSSNEKIFQLKDDILLYEM